MSEYGSLPGVQISTTSGQTGGVQIGREQYLIFVGVGNNATGDAATNTAIDVGSRADADAQFGVGSDLAKAYRLAERNGANTEFLHGVMAETTTTTSSVTGTASGQLANAPLIANTSHLAVTDTSNSVDMVVEFHYGGAPTAPSESDVIAINPHSGEWAVSSASDLDIEYAYADWNSALQAVNGALREREFAIVHPLTSSSSVVSTLQGVLADMRSKLKLALGLVNAEPTGNDPMGYPYLDPTSYTQSYDDETLFIAGPTALAGGDNSESLYGFGASPALAGLMAGAPTTEPVYDDVIQGLGDGLAQELSRAGVASLSDSYTIPLRDTGNVRVRRNQSSYDQEANGGFERDFFRRRLVDVAIGTAHASVNKVLGNAIRDGTVTDVQSVLETELAELAADGLLVNGGQSVSVEQSSRDTISVDLGVTPVGVAKQADVDLKIQV